MYICFWYLMVFEDGAVARDRQDLYSRVLDCATVFRKRYFLFAVLLVPGVCR